MHSNTHDYPNCLNCHYPLAKDYKFCPNCGQHPTDGKTSFGHLFLEFFEGLFHVDGKLFTTLRHVFVPGKLTEEFFKGRHKSYAAPFQLFLVLGGLFFLLISLALHDKDEEIKELFEREKTKYVVKNVLRTTDSINKTFDIYNSQSSVKVFANSVIKKVFTKFNPKTPVNNGKSLKKLKDLRENNDYKLTPAKKDSLIKKLMVDSILFIIQIADEKNISNYEAAKTAVSYADSIAKINTVSAPEININLNNEDDTKNMLENDSLTDFYTFSKDKKIYKISYDDIYNLKEDEISRKYRIEGFWARLFARQKIRFYKSGGNVLHYILSKSLWIILVSMFPIALFLKLLYRRQHKYLIEHFLFLMHFTCYFFIVNILYLGWVYLESRFTGVSSTGTKTTFFDSLLSAIYASAVPIGLWFAMYRFYKENILKTSLKFLALTAVALLIFLAVIILGLIVSFILF